MIGRFIALPGTQGRTHRNYLITLAGVAQSAVIVALEKTPMKRSLWTVQDNAVIIFSIPEVRFFRAKSCNPSDFCKDT